MQVTLPYGAVNMCICICRVTQILEEHLCLPQISPHDRPRCGSDRLGVAAEKAPGARSSTSAQGLSYIWALSDTLPLQVAGRGTGLAEGPQEHFGPSLALDDYGD